MRSPKYHRLIFLFALGGCATSNKEILSRFNYQRSEDKKIESDLQACEVAAYNAGYTRKGGLVTDGGRVEFLENCLEKKWKKL